MTPINLPGNICWSCSYPNDGTIGASSHDEATPNEGDFSICFRCASPGIFQKDLSLREPNEMEWKEIESSPDCQKAIKLVEKYRKELK